MNDIHLIGTAAQMPPLTASAVAAFDDAIRIARAALLDGSLDGAIDRLNEASRMAREVLSGNMSRKHISTNLRVSTAGSRAPARLASSWARGSEDRGGRERPAFALAAACADYQRLKRHPERPRRLGQPATVCTAAHRL
jgi:hypothetical protein